MRWALERCIDAAGLPWPSTSPAPAQGAPGHVHVYTCQAWNGCCERLLPQIDGESGHRLSLEGSVVHAIVTPCSVRSNNITVQLIQQVRGRLQARARARESGAAPLPAGAAATGVGLGAACSAPARVPAFCFLWVISPAPCCCLAGGTTAPSCCFPHSSFLRLWGQTGPDC